MSKLTASQAWWCNPVIPALRRLRWKEHEFEISLGYKVRPVSEYHHHNKNRTSYSNEDMTEV
jgi:hypothetical protein